FTRLPSVAGAIFEGAFGIDALCGGINGYIIKQAVSMGFRRGVFSNEAGLGTSVSAHAASDVAEPCVQGMWSIFEVFFDTIVMCSLTAVILLASPCNAPSAEEAFQNISLETQYFRLTEDDCIISTGAPMLVIAEGSAPVECGTVYADKLLLPIAEGDITFSNVMTVTGVQSVSENGEPLFADLQKNIPLIESAVISEVTGAQLSTYAFSQTFGIAAGKILAVAVVLFAFSTIIGWSYFGSSAAVYVFGRRAEVPFRCVFVLIAVLGSVMDFAAVWEISDLVNGLMIFPNLFALFVLSPKVFRITGNYCRRVLRHEDIPPLLSYHRKIQQEMERRIR
ncbi:MAG: alanine:cation symporter family protein, partial [Oscillospiraceae bacterium]|nr:alanine:cation symporter family protein [Oscillospiraceae bacterium]